MEYIVEKKDGLDLYGRYHKKGDTVRLFNTNHINALLGAGHIKPRDRKPMAAKAKQGA